jgi:hypothetical protein
MSLAPPEEPCFSMLSIGPATYRIFDVFPNAVGRNPHLNRQVATALFAKAADHSRLRTLWRR